MEFLVAIPVYNEEKYVLKVVNEVKKHAKHVLVVNDGSTDATPELLQQIEGIEIITHPQNVGYGRSLIDAFEYACRSGYEYIVTIDCDEQHDPRQIADFVAAAHTADIISGSRYMRASIKEDAPPPDRRNINARITKIINDLTGYNLSDSFCGFKGYRVGPVCNLKLTEPGYGMPLQLWLQSARHGLSVKEIPVKLVYGDTTRGFGSGLDNPEARFNYYMEVIEREAKACGLNTGS